MSDKIDTPFGKYDPDLQMLVEPQARPLNLNRLAYLRHLIETGKLEHGPAGPAGGNLVSPTEEITPRD